MSSHHGTRRSLAGGAVSALVAVALGANLAAGPRTPSFDQLYRGYAAGDHDVVRRAIRTGADVHDAHAPLDEKGLRKWLGHWNCTKAAFLLEFAESESRLSGHHLIAIAVGSRYVITRPTAIGDDAAEDTFEIAWHQLAVAVLEQGRWVQAQEAYLDTLSTRFATRPAGQHIPIDRRDALRRGLAREQFCAALERSKQSVCQIEAIRRYTQATLIPDTADEAFVRIAWLQTQRGEYAHALASLDRACPVGDPDLVYWQHLFRGRILDALDRLPEATAEYQAALGAHPGAHSAGVGLALTTFRLGQVDGAVAAAHAVETTVDASDPWWTYLLGDARFLDRLRGELRARLHQ